MYHPLPTIIPPPPGRATLRCAYRRLTSQAPLVVPLLGPKLKHWVQTTIETFLTVVAVVFAWYLQMIISAFYSGSNHAALA